jgi:DNA (cytosine-5)-methyltransferase 1
MQDEKDFVKILNQHFELSKKTNKDILQIKCPIPNCSAGIFEHIATIIKNAENRKGAVAVLITSLTKKIHTPSQNILMHKSQLTGGYSGRTLDTHLITPFLRDMFGDHYAMREAGWLTRSFEQVHPFNLNYNGVITPVENKISFLHILNSVEHDNVDPKKCLIMLFSGLITKHEKFKKSKNRSLISSKKSNLKSIKILINILKIFFNYNYQIGGASRLPVICVQTILQLLHELTNSKSKIGALESHTASDKKSHSLGDIDIYLEAEVIISYEIKHNKSISLEMVKLVKDKINDLSPKFYFILTTADKILDANKYEYDKITDEIMNESQTDVFLHNLYDFILHRLVIINDPNDFVSRFTENLVYDAEKFSNIKKTHLDYWTELIKKL